MNEKTKKFILKNKVKIVEEEDSKYIIKKSDKKLKELFEYLESRSFYNFPKILGNEDNEYRYEFIEETPYPEERKGKDIIEVISNLHYKTSYYKDVSKSKYRSIYDKLSENINYLKDYYNKTINSIEQEIYPSPSHYLLQRNYSVINGALIYCEKELKTWFRMVEGKTKERVAIVHNNLTTSHYLRNKEGYLINWDNYTVDTPILDLYKFYQNDAFKYNFAELLYEYNDHFKLTEEELKLLFIMISLPKKIDEIENELINTKNIKYIFDYLYNTNTLIASVNFKEK